MKKVEKQVETSVALDRRGQTDLFAQAVQLFQKGEFQKAGAMFARAASGPAIGVNESAQMYLRMCEQRLGRAAVELKTPDDYYHYAISLINLRRYRDARENLETAAAAGPQPHYCYALALVEGHLGSIDTAATHLRQAIRMDPALRSVVRGDPDFAPLLQNAKMREALSALPGTGG